MQGHVSEILSKWDRPQPKHSCWVRSISLQTTALLCTVYTLWSVVNAQKLPSCHCWAPRRVTTGSPCVSASLSPLLRKARHHWGEWMEPLDFSSFLNTTAHVEIYAWKTPTVLGLTTCKSCIDLIETNAQELYLSQSMEEELS